MCLTCRAVARDGHAASRRALSLSVAFVELNPREFTVLAQMMLRPDQDKKLLACANLTADCRSEEGEDGRGDGSRSRDHEPHTTSQAGL